MSEKSEPLLEEQADDEEEDEYWEMERQHRSER